MTEIVHHFFRRKEVKTIILAGGQSRRMGQNKSLMKLNGIRLIDRIIGECLPISEKVILVSNHDLDDIPEEVLIVDDLSQFKGQGPLAGIWTGLTLAKEGACLVVACDMPFISKEIAQQFERVMMEKKVDAVIPIAEGRMHPLFAVYHTRIKDQVYQTLLNGKRSVQSMVSDIQVEFYPMDEHEGILWNMNTMDDYVQAAKMTDRGV